MLAKPTLHIVVGYCCSLNSNPNPNLKHAQNPKQTHTHTPQAPDVRRLALLAFALRLVTVCVPVCNFATVQLSHKIKQIKLMILNIFATNTFCTLRRALVWFVSVAIVASVAIAAVVQTAKLKVAHFIIKSHLLRAAFSRCSGSELLLVRRA